MVNDIFRTYKKIIILLVILLCAVVFWFYGCHQKETPSRDTVVFQRESGAKNNYIYDLKTEDLQGKVTFGVKGYINGEGAIPVKLSLKSPKKNFTGVMKITLPGQDGKGVAYQAAVACKKGRTSETILQIPDLGSVSYFYFELNNQFGNTQVIRLIRHRNVQSGEEKVSRFGLLSDQAGRLEYLNSLSIKSDNESQEIDLTPMSAQDFPADEKSINSFQEIIIDQFDTSTLSMEQMNALTGWVHRGGTLIVAGGSRGRDNLSGLNNLLETEVKGTRDDRIEIYKQDDQTAGVEMEVCKYTWKNPKDWKSVGWSSPESVYIKQIGAGHAMLLSFSLADENLLQWTGKNEAVTLLVKTFLKERHYGAYRDDESLWYLKKGLYAFLNSQVPNTFFYGIFFLCYLITVGIVGYQFLKRVRRREYIWLIVPAIAVFFTVVLIVRLKGFSAPVGSTFSAVRVYHAKEMVDETYLLYQNQEGESRTIDLNPNISKVTPVGYEYRKTKVSKRYATSSSQNLTINSTSKGYDINFEEGVPGSSKILQLARDVSESERKQSNPFALDIETSDIAFSGTVTNQSAYDMSHLVLTRGNQYVILHHVKAGEKVYVTKDMVKSWTSYEENNRMFAGFEGSPVDSSLLEYIKQEYVYEDQNMDMVKAIGITDQMDIHCFQNGSHLKNQVTILVDSKEIPVPDNEVLVPDINQRYLIDVDQSPELKLGTLSKNRTEAHYALDDFATLNELVRGQDSFTGTITAYNYRTEKFDLILREHGSRMDREDLEPYLDAKGRMTLVYKLKDNQNNGAAPILTANLKR